MRLFNKEIPDDQILGIIKISENLGLCNTILKDNIAILNAKSIPIILNNYDMICRHSNMTEADVMNAIATIVNARYPMNNLFLASVLEGSTFPISIFENIIYNSRSIAAMTYYFTKYKVINRNELLNKIFESDSAESNFRLLYSGKLNDEESDIAKEIVLRKGSIINKLELARYCDGVDIEGIRNEIILSKNPCANYIMSCLMKRKQLSIHTNMLTKQDADMVNNIYDYYHKNYDIDEITKMSREHFDVVRKTQSPKYCFKLMVNYYSDEEKQKMSVDEKIRYYLEKLDFENIQLKKGDYKYLKKYLNIVDTPNPEKLVDKIEEIGYSEEASEYRDIIEMQSRMKMFN